ncbi:MAG: sugar ABC transporter permease [Clostridium sp.]|nr:sugar ABC transporter permease [Clostridium sp.]
MGKKEWKNLRNGLLFISPWIIGFCVFTLYPMIQALYYSFCNYNGFSEPEWIGLDNYVAIFTSDKLFRTIWGNMLYLVLFGTALILLSTLTISIVLNAKQLRKVQGVRALFYLPTLVPSIVLCTLWIWMFNQNNGLINTVLGWFGISGPGWLSSLTWSKPAFLIMRLWCAGNLIIIFLGGLQDIPLELYEAVDIDGGNFWHKSIYVTVPLLKPVILYNAINTMIGLLQMFTEPLVMTDSGGPFNQTYTIGLYIYKNAFQFSQMGYSSALAWILLVISMILTFIALRVGGFFNQED